MSFAKVVKHAPKPVVQPPTTYDIIGLTREEIGVISALLGRCNSAPTGSISTYDLYLRVQRELGSRPSHAVRVDLGTVGADFGGVSVFPRY